MAATFQSARGRRTRRSINDINMVPFIDVMLVLLIIFMVTAPLISPSVIDLPSVGKAATVPDQVIHVEISKDEKRSEEHTSELQSHHDLRMPSSA